MKILVVNWQDIRNPLGGGAEVHLHEIFKRLASQGHQVTLFSSSFPGALPEETIDNIQVVRSGSRNLFNLSVPSKYWNRFRRGQFDVVVDDINKIPFYTPLYVREPLVGIVHHLFGRTIFREASLPGALYVYGSELFVPSVYKNTPLAVVSESTRQELIQKGCDERNMFIVPNAVDTTLYRVLQPESGELVVGHLGRLKKYKSVEHLLEAFKVVRMEMPEAILTIVGDGDHRAALQRRTRELQIDSAVQFKGQVSAEEKVRLLNKMTVAVNCSAKEGWGLTVIEANACGVPVVASDVPGLRDAVVDGKTGVLYDYGNIEQLAQKILLVLRDQQLRKRLSGEALRWASSFTWEASAGKMLTVLQQAIELKKNAD
jgi:glycosyltransferase involved in cell wall biosynthesis